MLLVRDCERCDSFSARHPDASCQCACHANDAPRGVINALLIMVILGVVLWSLVTVLRALPIDS